MADFMSILTSYPRASIILIATALTFVSMIITYFLTDQKKMKELKAKLKECQEKVKQHRDNASKAMEFQKEMMACSMEQMKMGFKPMLITFIPFVLLFTFIRNVYSATLGSWFWYYLIAAIVSSMIFRKLLKM